MNIGVMFRRVGDVRVEVGGRAGVFGEFHGVGRPEDAAFAVRDLFQRGAVVEAEGVEPVLLLLSEGQGESARAEGDGGVVIGERLDVGGESEIGGAMDDLPVLVAIDGAGDEEIAAGVDIL